jgi:hypothetical protein
MTLMAHVAFFSAFFKMAQRVNQVPSSGRKMMDANTAAARLVDVPLTEQLQHRVNCSALNDFGWLGSYNLWAGHSCNAARASRRSAAARFLAAIQEFSRATFSSLSVGSSGMCAALLGLHVNGGLGSRFHVARSERHVSLLS